LGYTDFRGFGTFELVLTVGEGPTEVFDLVSMEVEFVSAVVVGLLGGTELIPEGVRTLERLGKLRMRIFA
jgi:hypothetical protein